MGKKKSSDRAAEVCDQCICSHRPSFFRYAFGGNDNWDNKGKVCFICKECGEYVVLKVKPRWVRHVFMVIRCLTCYTSPAVLMAVWFDWRIPNVLWLILGVIATFISLAAAVTYFECRYIIKHGKVTDEPFTNYNIEVEEN